jgi:hypothetical protein
MAALIKTAYNKYRYIFYECADPRVTDWFLLGSPLYPLGLITLYLYVVKVAGPRYMKNRPAYQLSGIILLYNVIEIVVNTTLFVKIIKLAMKISMYCRTVEYSNTPEDMDIAQCTWEFFLLKVLDLTETIFFVLRKRNNQVTALHVYHHILVVLSTWTFSKMGTGGHESVLVVMNCFVHVVMYSYYLMANIRPQYKKNIWWKMYVTQLQMVQFSINVVYFLSGLIVPSCQYPAALSIFVVLQNLIMLIMFYDFYRKAYRKQKHI